MATEEIIAPTRPGVPLSWRSLWERNMMNVGIPGIAATVLPLQEVMGYIDAHVHVWTPDTPTIRSRRATRRRT